MHGHEMRGRAAGVVLGLVLAVVFALLIAVIPESWFVDPGQRVALYLAQVMAAPLFVLVARAAARPLDTSARTVLLWSAAAALAFDGLALGFWPSLYGQTGEALAYVAPTLLWAFAWIIAAGLVLARETPQHRDDAAGVDESRPIDLGKRAT
jgi:hypothetical protein